MGALGDILAGCALKFDVCIMAVSKGVVIVFDGLIWQTCLLVRLNRILYDLHAKLRQYVFKRRSTIMRYVKPRFFDFSIFSFYS